MDLDKYEYLVPNVFHFVDRRCFPGWMIGKDTIDFHDLTFVMEGKACYIINGVEYIVEGGDLVYAPPGSVREAYTFDETPMHAYPFNFHWLDFLPDKLPFETVNKNMITKEIIDLIREFKQVWMSRPPLHKVQTRAIFMLIIQRLLSAYYRASVPHMDPRIKRVMMYIGENYSRNITIQDLAKLIKVHPVYLGRLFKQNTGLTYKEYINRIRINNAEMMLSEGDFSVTETAERCGFNDIAYFSNVFKAMKGYPPSAVRTNRYHVRAFSPTDSQH